MRLELNIWKLTQVTLSSTIILVRWQLVSLYIHKCPLQHFRPYEVVLWQ